MPPTNTELAQLSKREFYLLEEFKIGYDQYYRSETRYANWDSYFLLMQSIVIAATVQLFISKVASKDLIIGTISILGVLSSIVWILTKKRNMNYSKIRLDRLVKIEQLLAEVNPENADCFIFEQTQKVEIKNYEHGILDKASTWHLRLMIPSFIFIFWLIFGIYTLV